MIGTTIGGTNHESMCSSQRKRDPAPVRLLIHDRSVESASTLRGSLIVVHAIATGMPLLENFFPFHWKFCILIIYALNDFSIIMRYLVAGLLLEPMPALSSFMARATEILLLTTILPCQLRQ